MKRSLFVAAIAATALASLPFGAGAQVATAAKPVQLGISGGASLPTSDLSTGTNTGWNVTGSVGFNPSLIPLGVRVDGAYNRFATKGASGNFAFTSLTGNLVYKIPSASVTPYLIGGAGWYRASANLTGLGSGSDNHFGWDAGGGISMPLSGFDAFVEARYNQVQGNGGSLKFIPVTFGVMF